jgi:hypothetical protein
MNTLGVIAFVLGISAIVIAVLMVLWLGIREE